ncbi:flagellin [Pigmentibacter sp. JX0631]|uniref:flagellin N-terminal helical domain-containing protein n=1 Tax=Pigmentibacter sp. JX0631 TaxID=2976982 RepID=UPI00246988AF|nr:flagellin [Pigmentibacter sp. JX0631]WGL60288.1 flagellin [Pigmentibacter sp. JX0631]
MGLRIQTNMQSLNSQRVLHLSTMANDLSMEKLSSGYRINRAADDAAGLAISEKIKADIRGLNMAKRNANDGISMVQVAEGGMNEIGNILNRLRELSVQGASDTIGNNERDFINKEYVALKDEIDRITNSTEYNGSLLLIGKNAEDKIPDPMMLNRANTPPFEVQVGKNWYEGVDAMGIDNPFGRNPVNIIRIKFDQIDTSTVGLNLGRGNDDSEGSIGVFQPDQKDSTFSKNRAQRSIAKIDQAINTIAGFRADLGAIQNRLNSTIANLAIQSENFSAANSRIRDTDFAEETTRYTQSNILKQAGIAVLTQANQSPQAALRLLG